MRRRSENVGWGSICSSLNADRYADMKKRQKRDEDAEAGKVFYRRRTKQHPTSRIFEEKGRVR